jgi:threonine/homoserine/homoserine lactone efflux protein
MDFVGVFLLLGLGFTVGLSGALIPGPLLFYTINESLQKGRWTGALVIAGHAIVEVIVFILLFFGLIELISSSSFIKWISILGGLALMLMALSSLKSLKSEFKTQQKKMTYGVIMGGIVFTALNPSFPCGG